MLSILDLEHNVWSKKFAKCDPMIGSKRFNAIHHSDWSRFIISFMLKIITIIIIIIKIIMVVITISLLEMVTFDSNEPTIMIIITAGDHIHKMDGRLQGIKPMDMDSSIMDNNHNTSNVVDRMDTTTIPIGINLDITRIVIDRDIITVEMEDIIISEEKDHRTDRLWSL